MHTPEEYLATTLKDAATYRVKQIMSELPNDCILDLKMIVNEGETLKGVLGVTLTSIAYKALHPSQDIRHHQEGMRKGYSGRTFDTKYTTPFLKQKFPHFAMAESAWLTRSLEQPRPYDSKYPGKIRNKQVKAAFLNTLNLLQTIPNIAEKMLIALLSFMIEAKGEESKMFARIKIPEEVTIAKIVDAINQHIRFDYGKGTVGTARIPVLAIYAVYSLLLPDIKRYSGKSLAPLESHTSSDIRSQSVGDIEVHNPDGSCFEAVEIKHLKPVSVNMIDIVYRKIKNTKIDRYYVLTTSEPNCEDSESVAQALSKYRRIHPCQIIVNGVIPSLKYYLRLVDNPKAFIENYTQLLQQEYNCASGIKNQHLRVWQEIRQHNLNR